MNFAERENPAAPARSGRGRYDATVELNRPLCREHFLLRLRLDVRFPPTRPGQFIQLGCRPPDSVADFSPLTGRQFTWEPGEAIHIRQPELCRSLGLLRRPFSLSGRGDDHNGSWIEVVGRVVGVGTRWLSRLNVGDAVDLIGPLGNWFELPADKCLALLVGGGVGLPPMFYLAESLKAEGWDVVAFVGALSRDLLALTWVRGVEPNPEGLPVRCADEFGRFDYPTVITTDDGSFGLTGRVTDGLRPLLDGLPRATVAKTVVFTCGPQAMMRSTARMAESLGVACQVCLEQAMACGMGTCQSCVVRINPDRFHPERSEPPQGTTPEGRPWRYKLACTDGPVFESAHVVW